MLNFDSQLESASRRLREAVERARELSGAEAGPRPGVAREALAFSLERAAWAMIDLAQAWVYELRLGLPRKETESFDLLQRHGWLDLETARRYKQLCEFRSLSKQESERVDWNYLGGDLSSELGLFLQWEAQTLEWKSRHRPESTS